jgi:hypothetical protein
VKYEAMGLEGEAFEKAITSGRLRQRESGDRWRQTAAVV